jgi:hypothetical protein
MGWKAVLRSVIGTSHEQRHIVCQDYGNYEIFDDVLIAAIADGAGSAKYADIGAQLAVNTAITHLKKLYLRWFKLIEDKFPAVLHQTAVDPKDANLPAMIDAKIRKVFQKTLHKAIASLQKNAAENGYAFHDLACTLLLFIATDRWIAAMQIGDGFIVINSPESDYRLLFQPDKGEFINETTFVTSANALSQMQFCLYPIKQKFICASTDGLERVAIVTRANSTPFVPFFQPLEKYIQETSNPEQEDEYILRFLNSERLNARTDDDKTLFLCFFAQQGHVEPKQPRWLDCFNLGENKSE